jgi:hypothetical protein
MWWMVTPIRKAPPEPADVLQDLATLLDTPLDP